MKTAREWAETWGYGERSDQTEKLATLIANAIGERLEAAADMADDGRDGGVVLAERIRALKEKTP